MYNWWDLHLLKVKDWPNLMLWKWWLLIQDQFGATFHRRQGPKWLIIPRWLKSRGNLTFPSMYASSYPCVDQPSSRRHAWAFLTWVWHNFYDGCLLPWWPWISIGCVGASKVWCSSIISSVHMLRYQCRDVAAVAQCGPQSHASLAVPDHWEKGRICHSLELIYCPNCSWRFSMVATIVCSTVEEAEKAKELN